MFHVYYYFYSESETQHEVNSNVESATATTTASDVPRAEAEDGDDEDIIELVQRTVRPDIEKRLRERRRLDRLTVAGIMSLTGAASTKDN